MRVLYFSVTYENYSFISRQVKTVADTVDIYYACCGTDDVKANAPNGVKIISLPAHAEGAFKRLKNKLELSDLYFNLYNRAFSQAVEKKVLEIKPDIIHCQYGYDALIFLDNYYDPDLRYVITFRGFDASLLLILEKYRQKLQYYLSKPNVHPVFVCHALMNNLLEKSITLNSVRSVIYSNTDTAFYSRATHDHSRDTLVFTQVSNFREKKGHLYTVRAFEKFRERHPSVRFELNFVGELDEFSEKFSEQIAHSPIRDFIKLTGKKDRAAIRSLLEQSHAFVHNSVTSFHNDQEGIPNAIMEAMSMELPVIATKHSGIPELLRQDEDVFLAEERNIEEYVSCIEQASRTSYSKKNRDRITRSFSEEVFKRRILEFYDTVLHQHEKPYRQCTHCVLDTHDDPDIIFDDEGVCNYCYTYKYQESKYLRKGKRAEELFNKIVREIKESGENKPYDCILGLSGGVDSTYLAYIAKEAGLRPLAVHFDNGWNSELAVSNIEKIITRLTIPLYTFVVDWNEFKDLQLCFLKASVVDIEVATDHAIIAKLYDLAAHHGIKYVLSGTNIVTESVLPARWIFNKKDAIHVKAIHKLFGKVSLKTYPFFSWWLKWKVSWRKIGSISLLDYVPYNKKEVKGIITEVLGWRDYGGKHYESVFTRFYQGYILPRKFGIDKRKAHFSNLICSGQMTREEALEELNKTAYSEEMLKSDYNFVLKKLDLTEEAFQEIMQRPIKQHHDYPVEKTFYEHFPALRLVGYMWRVFKKLRKS